MFDLETSGGSCLSAARRLLLSSTQQQEMYLEKRFSDVILADSKWNVKTTAEVSRNRDNRYGTVASNDENSVSTLRSLNSSVRSTHSSRY